MSANTSNVKEMLDAVIKQLQQIKSETVPLNNMSLKQLEKQFSELLHGLQTKLKSKKDPDMLDDIQTSFDSFCDYDYYDSSVDLESNSSQHSFFSQTTQSHNKKHERFVEKIEDLLKEIKNLPLSEQFQKIITNNLPLKTKDENRMIKGLRN